MSQASGVLSRVFILLATAVTVVILLAGFDITIKRKKKNITKEHNQAAITLCQQYKDWSLDDCQLIVQHDIRLYMTDFQVEQSWGKPEKVVVPKKIGISQTHVEVWIYESTLLTFVEHNLTAIMELVI